MNQQYKAHVKTICREDVKVALTLAHRNLIIDHLHYNPASMFQKLPKSADKITIRLK